MAITSDSFLKIIPVTISGGEVIAGIATRLYTDTFVEDITTIAVYYNGQLIPGGAATVIPDSKYYYEFTTTNTLTNSTALVSGHLYKITTPGSTTWADAGATSNDAGTVFIATGTATGSGVADDLNSNTHTISFDIKVNAAYTAPDYTSGTSDVSLSTFDSVVISYYYIIYISA